MNSAVPAVGIILTTNAGVANFVGESIWQTRSKQGFNPPDIVIHRISGIWVAQGLEGPGDLWKQRVQIACRSESLQEAQDTMKAVSAALNNTGKGSYRGIVDDIDIQDCVPIMDVDQHDDTSAVYQRIRDFMITGTDVT